MRVRVAQAALSKALKAVSKGISSMSQSVAYDGGILLGASDGHLTVISSDPVRSIRYVLDAGVEEDGETVAPGELCAKIVENMSDEAMTVTREGTQTVLTCGTTMVRLHSLDPSCFPRFPEVNPETLATIKTDEMAEMVRMVRRCVAKDMFEPKLRGIHIRSDGESITVEATNRNMVGVCKKVTSCDPFEAIIDGNVLSDAVEMAAEDTISIGVSENQAIMTSGALTYVCRRYEGDFPDWSLIIPSDYTSKVTFDKGDMATALKRLKAIADDNGAVRFELDDVMRLTSSSPRSGDVTEEIGVPVDGEQVTFGLSYGYLVDCMTVIDGEVTMSTSASKPMVMLEADGARYVIGRMRT